jgi:hypothetical protein
MNTLNKTFLGENVIDAGYNRRGKVMPKKQAIVTESAAVASSARAAKLKTPRVKAAQHSRVVSTESVIAPSHPQDAVAQIAYGYWESRGRQGGSAIEDWLRAEHEYRQRLAATRL